MTGIFRRTDLPVVSDRPTVALVVAGGEVWEDFLCTIGVSLDQFCRKGPGGWTLGYMDALRAAGFATVVYFFSGEVREPVHYVQDGTGHRQTVLPAPRFYMATRKLFPTYSELLRRPPPKGVRQRAKAWLGSVLTHLSTPIALFARELRREGCKALIVQEYESFRFDVSVVLARRLGLRVFGTFQGGNRETNLASRLWKRRVIAASDALLAAPGEEIARVRKAYGPESRVCQVFNPVDVSHWYPVEIERQSARDEIGASDLTRVVVWHGRVDREAKGLDVLIEAWELLVCESPDLDARLLLLGSGQDAEWLGGRIRALEGRGIFWQNRYETDRDVVRRFLAAGDVYAFASRHEGFPVAPIEAMACGLPVVAAAASGVKDIFPSDGCGGVVVPVGDTPAFANALSRLVLDRKLSGAMGEQARRRVVTTFSVEAVGRQLACAIAGLPNLAGKGDA
ncbi:glycosyltransferase family 4 protein [Bradyrhizobium sp. SSUT18]|uniref:glycosyltransferase family 4 protein n=1 Tax=Bradyrhizobium sp. SSUT18 TaxID=3040602 RepID=UPI00244ACD4F|nr:glycosyltransferase family 4 protein [Bradyrhizobium sp. SSUT18]MDH2406094.1 glycosyltransferase family 4 protein [Bradyrhizobium sp. SSUT18]